MPEPAVHPGQPAAKNDPSNSTSQRAPVDVSGLTRNFDGSTVANLALGEHEMRRDLAAGILKVFIVGNAALWVLVVALVAIDVVTIDDGLAKPNERIIGQGVVETLIGATTVQVGVIMAVIARSLFRSL